MGALQRQEGAGETMTASLWPLWLDDVSAAPSMRDQAPDPL